MYLTDKLRQHIAVINAYNTDPTCLWSEPYYITEEYRADNVITADIDVNHDLFNKLHHHFEVLQGQAWNISDWFKNANNEVRYSIRQLNNLCHEMEILIKQIHTKAIWPQGLNPSAIVAFINSERSDLEVDDYKHFTLQRGAGRVFLGYCQIGKTHWEAFVDGDIAIEDSGISGLRYVSGEVTIDFGADTAKIPDHQEKIKKYAEWLESVGLDIANAEIGHGWLHVADVDMAPYANMSPSEIEGFLSKYLDLFKIKIIVDDQIVAEGTYDYHWNRSSFEQEQKDELFPTYKRFCNNVD